MNSVYDLTVVFRPDMDITEKTAKDEIQKLMGDGAKITEVFFQGKKELAYPIKKYNEGIYASAKLEGAHIRVQDLEKKIQLGTEVLRYLLTVKKLASAMDAVSK
jgi:small subunit ribosomal protein S6